MNESCLESKTMEKINFDTPIFHGKWLEINFLYKSFDMFLILSRQQFTLLNSRVTAHSPHLTQRPDRVSRSIVCLFLSPLFFYINIIKSYFNFTLLYSLQRAKKARSLTYIYCCQHTDTHSLSHSGWHTIHKQ